MFGNVQRWGTPQSTQVKTLAEVQQPIHDAYDAEMARWREDTGGSGSPINDYVDQNYGFMTPEQRHTVQNNYHRAASDAGANRTDFSGSNPLADMLNNAADGYSAAPDWRAYQDQIAATVAPFEEAQTRQRQAYGEMQGGNFFGGLINESYSDPNSGMISGRQGGLGGLGGMQMGQSTPAGMAAQGQSTTFGSLQGTQEAPQAQQDPKQLNAGWGGPFKGW